MFPSNTEGFGTGTVILLSSSTSIYSLMSQSWELYRSDLVLIADWTISCGTKADVFTSRREGKLSDVLAPVLAFLLFESGARDGVVVRTMESLTLSSCPLISSGTREFAFICWRLGPKVFERLSTFSVLLHTCLWRTLHVVSLGGILHSVELLDCAMANF